MSIRNTLLISAISFAFAFSTASAQTPSPQFAMKSPTEVQRALSALNRVVDHTQRLITAKNYSQLPRENMEFNDGSQALERSIANESSAFKTQVESVLKNAENELKNIADTSTTADVTKLEAMHGNLANTMKQMFAMFPASVQPAPPNLAREQQEDRATTTGSSAK